MPLKPKLVLKGGKEKHIRHGHPWIFASAIERVEDSPQPGWTADVVTYDGRWVAKAGYSPKSQLRARVWTLVDGEEIDEAFFERRIQSAVAVRHRLGRMEPAGGCRLINAEGDRLPGLVVDRFADVLVVQINSSPMEYWRETILNALEAAVQPRAIYERSDSDNRSKEGLDKRMGWVRGAPPEGEIEINEFGAAFGVDVVQGHKTGFYLDQAENRALVRDLSAGARVLNCFSYTGGFSVQAALGGAVEVVSVDSSQPALDLSAANFARNGLGDDERFSHWNSDVFKALEALRAEGRSFDVVILDPPKFASSGAHVERALHAYRKLSRAGIPLVAPGGLLLSFSCSGAVTPEAFQKSVTLALSDNHRRGRILRRLSAASDHVTDFGFAEGAYLKGLALEVE
jgi:23S rRNA (cytosine1962-C5)-methyltransferase